MYPIEIYWPEIDVVLLSLHTVYVNVIVGKLESISDPMD